jgi:protein SCO1/2
LPVVALLLAGLAGPANADTAVPEGLREVGVDQHLDRPVPADLAFRDESGRAVSLGDYFGSRPIVLSLAYYHCPMLCPLVLNGLAASLRALSLEPGRDFDVVTVSIDPKETAEQAAARKSAVLDRYGRRGDPAAWHFLTGSAEAVRRLADTVGFRYRYDAERDQYAHAAAVVVLTPEGRIARYFYGVEYVPRDLRLGLVEASSGTIGTLADQLLLFCYEYDPAMGRYSAAVMTSVRIGGIVTVLALAGFVALQLRRDRSRPRAPWMGSRA